MAKYDMTVRGGATKAIRFGALDSLERPVDTKALAKRIMGATMNKARLPEQRTDEEVTDTLRKKGW